MYSNPIGWKRDFHDASVRAYWSSGWDSRKSWESRNGMWRLAIFKIRYSSRYKTGACKMGGKLHGWILCGWRNLDCSGTITITRNRVPIVGKMIKYRDFRNAAKDACYLAAKQMQELLISIRRGLVWQMYFVCRYQPNMSGYWDTEYARASGCERI